MDGLLTLRIIIVILEYHLASRTMQCRAHDDDFIDEETLALQMRMYDMIIARGNDRSRVSSDCRG